MKLLLALGALAAVVVAAIALAAPSESDGSTATITTRGGAKIVLDVEIARTAAERERGLMHRRSLAPKAGMVFVYRADTRGGFWMKNTLIPLDIAFVRQGRIVRILTMTPCRRDPCRIYDPGVAYRSALEVNAGSFRRWNVRVGDRVVVR